MRTYQAARSEWGAARLLNSGLFPSAYFAVHHRAAPNHETTPPPDAAARSGTADTPDTRGPCAGTRTPAHSAARSMVIAMNR